MRLPGKLSASTLGDVLGSLYRGRVSGVLELRESTGPSAGRLHRVRLVEGAVAGIDSAVPVARLGEILRRQGLLDARQLQRLLARLAAHGDKSCGELLVQDRVIAPAVVDRALREQLLCRLDALFSIAEANIAFRAADGRNAAGPSGSAGRLGVPKPPTPLAAREFLHGRPRKRDGSARQRERSSGHDASSFGSGPGQERSSFRAGLGEERSSYRPDLGQERSSYRSSGAGHASPACAPPSSARARALAQLGLSSHATDADVRRAFRKLAGEVHPDRHGAEGPEALRRYVERFAAISAAYHTLVA